MELMVDVTDTDIKHSCYLLRLSLGTCCKKVKFLPPRALLDRFQSEPCALGSDELDSGGCPASCMVTSRDLSDCLGSCCWISKLPVVVGGSGRLEPIKRRGFRIEICPVP